MKTYMLIIVAFACSLSLNMGAYARGDAYVVVVHPDNPAKTISKAQVSRLLLKK